MASSLRRNQDKQLRKVQNDRPGISSAFKQPQRPPAAAASVQDKSRDIESEMEIFIAIDVTHHPSGTRVSNNSLQVQQLQPEISSSR